MAKSVRLAHQTQIYLDAVKLLEALVDAVVNFPKMYKYTIGERLIGLSEELLGEITAAYMLPDLDARIEHLTEFQIRFSRIKTLTRIAGQRKWMGLGRYAVLVELLDRIGKQSTAWKGSLVKAREQKRES